MTRKSRRAARKRDGSGSEHRFDVEPLLREFADLNVAASTFGVDRRTIHRWLVGGVDWITADEIASQANRHPMFVWGDEWLEVLVALGDEDQQAPALSLFDPFAQEGL